MRVKGYVYYYVVHRDGCKWYSHYIGRPSCLRVPVTLGPRDHLSIAPFFGGKKFMLKHLAMLVPPHEVYVEVFGGMAAFLLNKPRSKPEVYNDIDGDLVNVFKVIRDRWEEFVERYMWLIPSKQLYIEMRDKWLRGEKPRDLVERAAWFVFLHRLAYGGSLIKGYAGTGSQISRCVIPQSIINVRSMTSRSLIPLGFVGDKRVASRDQLRNDTERALRNWIKRITQDYQELLLRTWITVNVLGSMIAPRHGSTWTHHTLGIRAATSTEIGVRKTTRNSTGS